mmetsp:Transcript_91835/g.239444  ORF Transcript_91835/g.239444 Transcript_91835/m.239444 type:complete len:248 (+) Transcript_91835:604-1347(+)
MSRFVASAMLWANSGASFTFSFCATFCSTARTSSAEGAGTRTGRHRLLSGAMIFETLSQVRMIRHVFMNFSIVRRSAACASVDRQPASSMTTTLKGCPPMGGCWATSLISCMITALSLLPMSEGVTERWWFDTTTWMSMVFDGVLGFGATCRVSTFLISTPCPKISRSSACTRVAFPDPVGPAISMWGISPDLAMRLRRAPRSWWKSISSRLLGRCLSTQSSDMAPLASTDLGAVVGWQGLLLLSQP